MPVTRRHKSLKKFRYHCNRKRFGRARRKQAEKIPVTLPVLKKAWDEDKSIRENVSEMGLCFDVNATIKIPSTKEILVKEFKKTEEEEEEETPTTHLSNVSKSFVVSSLEEEANAPREKRLELPKGQVMWLSYLIDKYGDDFKAMARDSKNLYQETWKQLRAKIRTFKSIPSQWNQYVASKQEELKQNE